MSKAVDKTVRHMYNICALSKLRTDKENKRRERGQLNKKDNNVGQSVGNAALAPDYTKKLPDAEFEVMLAIWNAEVSPVNTGYLMDAVGKARQWKAPTLISFLVRLEDRGFISSFKNGKERYYEAVADKSEYIRAASEQFIRQYHGGSFVRMMDSLYSEKKLSEEDIDELLLWLKSKY